MEKEEKVLDYIIVDRLISKEYDIKTRYVIFFSNKKVVLISISEKIKWIGTGLILGALALALAGIILKNFAFFVYSITMGIFLGLIFYAVSPALRNMKIRELRKQSIEKLCLMRGASIFEYENIRKIEGHEFESLPLRGFLIPSVPSYLYKVILATKFGEMYTFLMDRKTYEKCMRIFDKFVSQNDD